MKPRNPSPAQPLERKQPNNASTMRDLKRYPDENPDIIIIDEEEVLLYGHKLLREIKESGEGKELQIISDITYQVFIVYLFVHFPNYECVMALKRRNEKGIVTAKELEAISDARLLTAGDAMHMKDIQAEQNRFAEGAKMKVKPGLEIENSVANTIAFLEKFRDGAKKLQELRSQIAKLPVSNTRAACVDSIFELPAKNATWVVGLTLYAYEPKMFHVEMCRIGCRSAADKTKAKKELDRMSEKFRATLHLPHPATPDFPEQKMN
jgi:hypothetical protein